MRKSGTPDLCPLCGGRKRPGKATFSADIGAGIVVVRHVKATICSQCGEEWLDSQTAQQLESVISDARQKRMLVEVTTL